MREFNAKTLSGAKLHFIGIMQALVKYKNWLILRNKELSKRGMVVELNMVDLHDWIIKPSLTSLGVNNVNAEWLLLGTALYEYSRFHQLSLLHKGYGIYNISAERHQAIWDQYLIHQPELASMTRGLASQRQFLAAPHQELASNMAFATAIAWLIYEEQGLRLSQRPYRDSEFGQLWARHFNNGAPMPRRATAFTKIFSQLRRDCPSSRWAA